MAKRSSDAPSKGEATKQRILDCALASFRKHGVAQTTMRDVAEAAGMSLGAAYHYFPSKDAIVAGYFEWMQDEHERRLADAPPGSVAARLQRVLETKIEIVRKDRKIIDAQLGHLGDPSDPLSLFSDETASLRRRSIALFERVFEGTGASPQLHALAGYAAWLVHLGILFAMVQDRSRDQRWVRLLISSASELFGLAMAFADTPLGRPFVERAIALAVQLGVPGVVPLRE
ncbi:MAG: TetR/AcrR family transcriptional regulator [Deltaproteobacteria bacterium]|nr:TetR/AcrR family transcriptional regulator [Deltaproteobacteria bacterium]